MIRLFIVLLIPILELLLYYFVYSPESVSEIIEYLLSGICASDGDLDIIKAIYWFCGTTPISLISLRFIGIKYTVQLWMTAYRHSSKTKVIISVIVEQICFITIYWIIYSIVLFAFCSIIYNGFNIVFLMNILVTSLYSICIVIIGYLCYMTFPHIEFSIIGTVSGAVALSIVYSSADLLAMLIIEFILFFLGVTAINFLSKNNKVFERLCGYEHN